ncbi:hypothetical protein CS022_01995 [Veronia nyctiphanis]|uniref:G domain-containing protein n=1 Tax=Veronia nyctiphanis TaxID=1278244 RepID=A0A4Q0YVY8_9GAMM|nr:hypothetical protein [Veronia nyctiphanis]RXJ74404.1 hypothetical protein CS022_01995 [Veronia nyctiphanis]
MTLIMPSFGDGGFVSDIRQQVLRNNHLDDNTKERFKEILSSSLSSQINMLFIGEEGVGVTSTVDALFKKLPHAEETLSLSQRRSDSVTRRSADGMVIWDCAISGDGFKDHQKRYQVRSLLEETDKNGKPLIDLVVAVFDASSMHIHSCVSTLNHWVLPSLGRFGENRLMVLGNKADNLSRSLSDIGSSRHCVSDGELCMDVVAASFRYQMIDKFGLDVRPVFCAANPDTGAPFNLIKLLSVMTKQLNHEKRPMLFNRSLVWGEKSLSTHDKQSRYLARIEDSLFATFFTEFNDGARLGGRLGERAELNGQAAGKIIQQSIGNTLRLSNDLL